ncbi:2OG-Fe(II) oxygenase [Hymenobacter metallicola]|nr:2OG-Fe(II) oxygenase [Hymenobacter metallicola]
MKAAFPQVRHLLTDTELICFIVPGAFSAAACDALLTPAIKAQLRPAATHYPTYYRNNERCIVDSEALARQLFTVIEPMLPSELPAEQPAGQPWRLKQLNSRLRFCRYAAGQYFHRHLDGMYHESETVQSRLTFMVYLNDAADFSGGRTLFYRNKDDAQVWAEYHPAKGDLIVFDHRLWHEGEQLEAGEKYVLRSDILYETTPQPVPQSVPFAPGHLGYIWQVLPFGEELLSAGRDKLIKVWGRTGELRQHLAGHQNSILSLCQLNAQTLLSGSRDMTVKVWGRDAQGFTLRRSLDLHPATILSLHRLTDQLFVSTAADGLIKISDELGQVHHSLAGHTDWVWQAVPVAAELLVSSSEDGTLRLWNWRRNTGLQCIGHGLPPAHALLFDPEQRRLLAGNYAGQIQIWQADASLQHWEVLTTLAAHHGIVRTLTLLPDGRLVSGGEDSKVKVWDLATGTCQQEMAHNDFVQSTAWLRESRQLISASYDGRLSIWALPA